MEHEKNDFSKESLPKIHVLRFELGEVVHDDESLKVTPGSIWGFDLRS